jgi:chromate transporter
MTYLYLALEFFKIGLFSIGGGMATLPFLFELTEKYDWYTASELTNMIAVSESTPGPVGINMATYAGYSVAGIPGAIIATLSLVAPSIIIIVIIARFLSAFRTNFYVESAFYGIRPAVAALIAYAVWGLFKVSLGITTAGGFNIDWVSLALTFGIFGLLQIKQIKKLHPLFVILFGAAIGLILKL